MTCIVDTNVAMVANEIAPPDNLLDCCEACVERLRKIMISDRVALDDDGQVWEEYKPYMRWRGQLGVGHEFFKWVHDNQWNEERCDRVAMAPFPEHPTLASFDFSDRKFVQVSLGHPERPPVLVAADSDWHNHAQSLAAYIRIEFLCQVRAR
jgi:hypothetical protein